MPKYTLTYFPFKGLGEGPRLLLAYGGEGFEDKRIQIEQWSQYQPETPFGQVPMLEFDGKKFAQSDAICRYLGHKYNLAGANLEEDLIIDQNLGFVRDIGAVSIQVLRETDEELKAKKRAEFNQIKGPVMWSKLNEILLNNNGYLALGRLTWADFVFASIYESIKNILEKPDLDKQYPAFVKLEQTVLSLPKVKEYNDAAYPK